MKTFDTDQRPRLPRPDNARSNALGLLMVFVFAVIACCVLYVVACQVLSYKTLIPTFVDVPKVAVAK